jgi:hypothetical protein
VPCPAGTFGAVKGLKDATCSGQCRPGYYCPQGSTSPRQVICPAGTFGSTLGLTDDSCSGPCMMGYFCPNGSTTSSAIGCGDPALYCPTGSGYPRIVGFGYYSTGGPSDGVHRHGQALCGLGYYCHHGVQYSCPAGTYGDAFGLNYGSNRFALAASMQAHDDYAQLAIQEVLNLANGVISVNGSVWYNQNFNRDSFICSGFCSPGYFCPPNSTSPMQVPCAAGRYGNSSGLQNSTCTAVCPVGHFCPEASVVPIKCPAGLTSVLSSPAIMFLTIFALLGPLFVGLFGNTTGLISAQCSTNCWGSGCVPNKCHAGFYCPEGSTVGDQVECGDNCKC